MVHLLHVTRRGDDDDARDASRRMRVRLVCASHTTPPCQVSAAHSQEIADTAPHSEVGACARARMRGPRGTRLGGLSSDAAVARVCV
jgi:hypothetical protein